MTRRNLLTITGSFLILCVTMPLVSQQLSFRSLGADEGMRTLTSWHCTYDGYGYLWASTTDGLVRYNGSNVSYFYTQSHPQLPSDPTGYLFCDRDNNLWICTPKGLTRANPARILERQFVVPEDPDRPVHFCFEDSRGHKTAISKGAAFQQGFLSGPWVPLSWLDAIIDGSRIRDIRRFDEDSYLLVMPGKGVSLINLLTETEVAFFPLVEVSHAIREDNNRILLSRSGPFQFYQAFVDEPDSLLRIDPPSSFLPKDVKTEIEHMALAANGKVYIATDGSGLVEYDLKSKRYHVYKHEASNRFSILDDALRYIIADSLGNIAFTSLSGVNFTNVRPQPLEYINSFKTIAGEIFNQRVISIAEDTTKQIWIVMEPAVLLLSPDRMETRRLSEDGLLQSDQTTITYQYAAADHHGRVWVAMVNRGVGVFNTDGKMLHFLSAARYPDFGNAIERIRIMHPSHDGYMYIGAENGLFRIHQQNFLMDTFALEPELAPLRKSRIVDILTSGDELWVSTSPGGAAWKYSFSFRTLQKFNTTNGLVSNRVYGLAKDKEHNVYIGSYEGLTIIHPDGQMDHLTKGKGLPSTRIEAIEMAHDGSIWMTNTYNLLRLDPKERKATKVQSHSGYSRVNYQIMSSTILSSGELVFGTHKGMVIVDNQKEQPKADTFHVFVFLKNTSGHEFLCNNDQPIRLKANEQLVRLSFGISDILLANQMIYRYRLSSGKEGSWSEPSHLSGADLNLGPGNYTLEVEASDGNVWYRAPGPIVIKVAFPWWRKWWFLLSLCFCAALGIWYFFRNRMTKYRKELTIARQIAELESKALRAQMNPHFVFNSLNAIQECIVTGRIEEAYTYLSQFSRLLRLVLEHSDMAEVTLHEELEVLSLFVSLEKLRFRNDMQYIMKIDENLDEEEIRIPPMLIQPHLENAIWHGLRNKEGEKVLKLSMTENIPGYLTVMIEDNGIGRAQAAIMRQGRLGVSQHKSKGKQLSGNRMDLLKNNYPMASMTIIDLYHPEGGAAGTQIQLIIPILEQRSKSKSEV